MFKKFNNNFLCNFQQMQLPKQGKKLRVIITYFCIFKANQDFHLSISFLRTCSIHPPLQTNNCIGSAAVCVCNINWLFLLLSLTHMCKTNKKKKKKFIMHTQRNHHHPHFNNNKKKHLCICRCLKETEIK